MKNTLENKAKLFAQYWRQKVAKYDESEEPVTLGTDFMFASEACGGFLELKPLSQITDEDAIEVFTISKKWKGWMYRKDTKKLDQGRQIVKDFISDGVYWHPHMLIAVSDFLRSKGYALPYMGISVKQQIEWGWVKLKSESNEI